jgi:hypothetical protein
MFMQQLELPFFVVYRLLITSVSKLHTNRRRNFCHLWLTEVCIDNLNYSYLRPSVYDALLFRIPMFIICFISLVDYSRKNVEMCSEAKYFPL